MKQTNCVTPKSAGGMDMTLDFDGFAKFLMYTTNRYGLRYLSIVGRVELFNGRAKTSTAFLPVSMHGGRPETTVYGFIRRMA